MCGFESGLERKFKNENLQWGEVLLELGASISLIYCISLSLEVCSITEEKIKVKWPTYL